MSSGSDAGALDIFNFDVHRNLLREIAVKSELEQGTGLRQENGCRPYGTQICTPRYPALRCATCWAKLFRASGARFSLYLFRRGSAEMVVVGLATRRQRHARAQNHIRHINTVNSFGKFGLTAKE